MSLLAEFLRRWSILEITDENALLFEEHLMGVRSILSPREREQLAGLTRNTPRSEFARRFAANQAAGTNPSKT